MAEQAWTRWVRIFVDNKLAAFADATGKAIAERDRVLRAELRREFAARADKADDADTDTQVIDMRKLLRGGRKDAA